MTAAEVVQAATDIVRRNTSRIAEILDPNQPAVVPLWSREGLCVGKALGLAESTTYQLAAENKLPIEVIRLGRRRVARLVDLQRFLRLLPEENGNAPGFRPGALPNEHITDPTAK